MKLTERKSCGLLIPALLAVFPCCVDGAGHSMIVDAQGFEAPAYINDTNLIGQPSASPAAEQWKYIGLGASLATVQNTVTAPSGGAQALRVGRAPEDDSRWAVPVDGLPTSDIVLVSWSMRVDQRVSASGLGPFFGVEAYDGDVLITESPAVVGALGMDATTGDVLYQSAGSGVLTPTGVAATFDEWHDYRMALDYENRVYQVFLNGFEVASEGFVDGWADEFTDADISALAAGFDTASRDAIGFAYYDNFLVEQFDRLEGDYDVDGDVDIVDYQLWRFAFGDAVDVAGTGADGNGNGVVDAGDYTVWRDHLGTSVFGPAAAVATPEPLSVALLGAAAGAIACSRCRRDSPAA